MQNDCLHDWKDIERYPGWIFRSGAAGALLPEPLNIGHSAWSGIRTEIDKSFLSFRFLYPAPKVRHLKAAPWIPIRAHSSVAEAQNGTAGQLRVRSDGICAFGGESPLDYSGTLRDALTRT